MTSGRYFQPFQVRERMYQRRQLESSTLLLHATKYMHFKETSINNVKWHPWFLLKGNKRFSWTSFLNTRWKLPLYYPIVGSRPSLSIWYFLSYRWDSCQPYFPRSCQNYFLHRKIKYFRSLSSTQKSLHSANHKVIQNDEALVQVKKRLFQQ